MAMRVAVGRIIAQKGDERAAIEPGVRFDSAEYGISDADLRTMEANGVVRRVRDQTVRAPAEGGPVRAMQEGATVEDRSGPVSDATSDVPNKTDAGPATAAASTPVTAPPAAQAGVQTGAADADKNRTVAVGGARPAVRKAADDEL